jgi:hypothetical protein
MPTLLFERFPSVESRKVVMVGDDGFLRQCPFALPEPEPALAAGSPTAACGRHDQDHKPHHLQPGHRRPGVDASSITRPFSAIQTQGPIPTRCFDLHYVPSRSRRYASSARSRRSRAPSISLGEATPTRPVTRRRGTTRSAAPGAKPRTRRRMSRAARQAVSEHMTAYWANRRAELAKAKKKRAA